MWRYFELLSFTSMVEINRWRESVNIGANPRDIKVRLAEEIVTRFHSANDARIAHENFNARFQRHEIPDNLPELVLRAGEGGVAITQLLKQAGLVASTSDALRMIEQGAVKIDGERLENKKCVIVHGKSHVYQVGKRRFARVTVITCASS